jgi:hypothetical protein
MLYFGLNMANVSLFDTGLGLETNEVWKFLAHRREGSNPSAIFE